MPTAEIPVVEIATLPEVTVAPPPPPPVENWVPATLLSIIDSVPESPALRGLIRSELFIVLPARTEPWTSADLRSHLLANYSQYLRTPAGAEATMHATLLSAAARRAVPPVAEPTTPAALIERREVGGRSVVLLRGVSIRGVETGTAQYTAQVEFRGDIFVPESTVRQGEVAVQSWIRSNRSTLAYDPHSFEYTDFEADDTNWRSSDLGNFRAVAQALPPPV